MRQDSQRELCASELQEDQSNLTPMNQEALHERGEATEFGKGRSDEEEAGKTDEQTYETNEYEGDQSHQQTPPDDHRAQNHTDDVGGGSYRSKKTPANSRKYARNRKVRLSDDIKVESHLSDQPSIVDEVSDVGVDKGSKRPVSVLKATSSIGPVPWHRQLGLSTDGTGQKEQGMLMSPTVTQLRNGTPHPCVARSSANILFVHISKTDRFPENVQLVGPIVRVHVVDPSKVSYLQQRGSVRQEISDDQQAELLNYPGRPQLLTIGNNAGNPGPAVMDYIPSVQTNHCKPISQTEFCAEWGETLVINAESESIAEKDAVLLFEILQSPTSFSGYHQSRPSSPTFRGYQLVAWAFLKIKGKEEDNTGELRLQLYHYSRNIVNSARDSAEQPTARPDDPIFSSWSLHSTGSRCKKYPATLRVRVGFTSPPDAQIVTTDAEQKIRPFLPAGFGTGFETGRLSSTYRLWGASNAVDGGNQKLLSMAQNLGLTEEEYSLHRPPDDSCEVPNCVHCELPGYPQGTSVLSFSNDGKRLAMAWGDSQDVFKVSIWASVSGKLLTELSGHHDLVYDMDWSPDDKSLITASSDFTAKTWSTMSGEQTSILQHSCFVYSCAFHPLPKKRSYVTTGGYDGFLRVWSCEKRKVVDGIKVHNGYVNATIFEPNGLRLYSGDSLGIIAESSYSDERGRHPSLKPLRVCKDLVDQGISCLRIHGGGRKLFAGTKTGRICIMDMKVFGCVGELGTARLGTHLCRFDISSDGQWVIFGSQDGKCSVWNVENGMQVDIPAVNFR
ncbi:hypothetical protein BSKO_00544 [Bryopsis sp. KO-2023]|nr:hypothetical protein BSKO_00544 [Bryopsis sp. KO-2023]